MEMIKGFFADDQGNFSIMRLKTLLTVLTGLFVIIWHTVFNLEIDHFIVVEILGIGFGFKIWQKQIEKNSELKKQNDESNQH